METQEVKLNVESFEDLVKLCKSNDTSPDVQGLHIIKKPLLRLHKLVGMKELKKQIMYQILFVVQGLESGEMMHTALMGSPGVGKTTVAKIIADIYTKLGLLTKGKLICVTREDLVGQYLGETAIKTRNVLECSKGNVLFIDEAYSLGNGCSGDSYSKECVDTLVAFLSENTKNFVCIIAGYETELRRYFFDSNPGLDRRFPWKYTLESYAPDELLQIFEKNVKGKWKLKRPKETLRGLHTLLEQNKELFANNGGDVITLLSACKMAHSKRVFGMSRTNKMALDASDIKLGFELYKRNKRGKDTNPLVAHMYV